MRTASVTYAYRHHGSITILPRCSTMKSLLAQIPEFATPGKWDEKARVFKPFSGRTVEEDFGKGEEL